jgi:hypothetical protein
MLVLLRRGSSPSGSRGSGRRPSPVGVTAALREDDWILPMHRNLGVFTAAAWTWRACSGSSWAGRAGLTKGRDRTFHFGILEHRIVGMISHLAAMLPGRGRPGALAATLRGEKRRGRHRSPATAPPSEGDFHEAVNLAAVWKLPVLFVMENNQYGLSTPVSEQYACARLSDRALGTDRGGDRGRERRPGRARGRLPRAAARRGGRGPDAARVPHLPHARPRGGLGDRLRPQAPLRGVEGSRTPSCASRGAAGARPSRRRERRRRCGRRSRRASTPSPDEALPPPIPDSTAEAELADV